MLWPFKKPVKRKIVVADVVQMHLMSLLGRIKEILDTDYPVDPIDSLEESIAFVYVIGIFGIQASRLNAIEKHKFSMELTSMLSEMLVGPRAIPRHEKTLFLQERLKEYRTLSGPIEMATAYVRYMKLEPSKHVALTVEMAVSVKYFDLIRKFINSVNRKFKFD